jgi:NCS1 family nucleobase:cation symporter-1
MTTWNYAAHGSKEFVYLYHLVPWLKVEWIGGKPFDFRNSIVLIPMILTVSWCKICKIPFPVFARSSFLEHSKYSSNATSDCSLWMVRNSNLIGGFAIIYQMARLWFPSIETLLTNFFSCFFGLETGLKICFSFWLLNMYVVYIYMIAFENWVFKAIFYHRFGFVS